METTQQKPKTFHQDDFATKLRVPEGTNYVEAHNYEQIKEALEKGLAVYAESCDGRAFVWRDGDKFYGELFFRSPAKPMEFKDIEAAADFASGLCEGNQSAGD